MIAKACLKLSLFIIASGITQAVPINLLTNPGFETGNAIGWTTGGTSPQWGVAPDGSEFSGDAFGQGVSNVRSGNYSLYAQVKGNPAQVLTIAQTLSVLENQTVEVGFYVGHGEGTAIGVNAGDAPLHHTKILVDGTPLSLTAESSQIPGGEEPEDFISITGSFNTGSKSQLTITFQLDGSGTIYAINSFDDFFAISEPRATRGQSTVAPDASNTSYLMMLGLGFVGALRLSRKNG
jgi:hypothetical protein